MLTILLFTGFTFLSGAARPLPTLADTVFIGTSGEKLATRHLANRWLVNTKAAAGVKQDVFDGRGRLLQTVSYADADAHVREGEAMYWNPDHTVYCREHYVANALHGQRIKFYPNGTISRLEVYAQGNVQFEQCFAPDGTLSSCVKTISKVTYLGGDTGLENEVKRRTNYPPSELESGKRGQVFVGCLIAPDGHLQSTSIGHSMGAAFDAEALRVVQGLSKGWQVLVLDGEPRESTYTVVVNFISAK